MFFLKLVSKKNTSDHFYRKKLLCSLPACSKWLLNERLLPKDVEWLFRGTFQNTMKLQCGSTPDNFFRCPKDLCNGHYRKKSTGYSIKKWICLFANTCSNFRTPAQIILKVLVQLNILWLTGTARRFPYVQRIKIRLR